MLYSENSKDRRQIHAQLTTMMDAPLVHICSLATALVNRDIPRDPAPHTSMAVQRSRYARRLSRQGRAKRCFPAFNPVRPAHRFPVPFSKENYHAQVYFPTADVVVPVRSCC